jgi:hypothetical protein
VLTLCCVGRSLLLWRAAGSIIVARDGGWKLAGFEFVSSSADGFAGSSTPQLAFEYTSAHPSPWEEYSQVGGREEHQQQQQHMHSAVAATQSIYSRPLKLLTGWLSVMCCVLWRAVQPPLGFTPPELVGGCSPGSEVVLSGAADCFSLAALTYLLVAGEGGGLAGAVQ